MRPGRRGRREEASAPGPRRPTVLAGNPDFTRFWWGQALTALGGRVSDISLPLIVLGLTGSALWAGLFATTRLVTLNLARLPAGAFADRWDRRTVMVRVDLARAVVWGALAVSVGLGRVSIGALVAVGIVDGLVSSFYNPSLGAALRHLVPAADLGRAVALNESRAAAAGLVGPVVGGALVAVSPWLPLATNAVAYAVCALLVSRIHADLGGRAPATGALAGAVLDGLRVVWRQPFLRATTVWSALLNFATAAAFFAVVPLLSERHTAPALIGAMSGLIAGAGLLGAVVAPRVVGGHRHLAVVASGIVLAAAVAVAALVPSSVVVVVCLAVVAAVAPVITIAMTAEVYSVIDDALTARVLGTMTTVGSVFYPLSFVVMGGLLDRFGAGAAYGVVAVVLALCIPVTLDRSVRAQLAPVSAPPVASPAPTPSPQRS